MADAPKLLGTDTLRKAYPKLNTMIDLVNNFKAQIDQMTIEGDSSVEAAQARVDADGNPFTTLKERLDFSDGRLNLLERQFLNVRDYGADPTGINYSDQAFRDAILDAQNKKIPLLIDGNFKFADKLTIPSNVKLIGSPGSILDGSNLPIGSTYGNSYLLEIQGEKGTGIPLTADISRFSKNLTVSNVSSFGKGDLIYIQSPDKYDPTASTIVEKSDVLKIERIEGSTLFLEGSVFWGYSASTTTVYKINPAKNIAIENIHIRMGEGKAQAGIHCEFAENLKIRSCKIEKGEDAGIYLTRCYNTKVLYNEIFDCVTPATFTAGYGVAVGAASRYVLIEGNHFWNNRHSVTGGGGAGGFVQVMNNTCTGDSDNSLDMHEPCFNWQFVGNKVQGSFGGIIARGQDVLIANNEIVDVTENAIIIKAFSYTITEARNFNINGNRINGAGNGIFLDGMRGALRNATISNNTLDNCSGEGIFCALVNQLAISGNVNRNYGRGMRLQECNRITITGNNFDHGMGATTNGKGDAASIYNCGMFTVTGNSFKDGGQHLKIEYCGKGYTIEGNIFENAGVYGIMLGTSSPNGVVIGNTFRDMDTTSAKAIRTFVANLIISNNLFLSNSGNTADVHFTNASNIVLTGNILKSHYTDSAISNFVNVNNITVDIA